MLCSSAFRTGSIRNVPDSEKHQVEVEYGMVPRSYGRTIEIDHIVSLELGGSNDIANLYPEPGSGLASYHVKDRLENELHDLVCAGTHDPPRCPGRDRVELGGALPARVRSRAVTPAAQEAGLERRNRISPFRKIGTAT